MHRVATARTLRLGLLGACLLAVCACGGGAKPLSEEYGSLSLGTYVADGFQPALSFEVGEGWEVPELQQKPYLEILREYRGATTSWPSPSTTRPLGSATPRTPTSSCPRPKTGFPGTKSTPASRTSEPQPTSVGGVQGRLFDTAVSDLPEGYYSQDCLGMGVPLWPLFRGHHWCAELEGFDRTIVLDGVEGETVIIDVWSDTGASGKVLPEAKEVLETVKWEDA